MVPGPTRSPTANLVDDLVASTAPTASARTLPARCYHSDAFHDFEREAVFARSWLCIGRVEQLPHPGDYLATEIDEEPILAVRGDDGEVRVFSAVCRHRGHLVAEPGTCGSARTFTCPLHSWSYDRTGRLVGAPRMHRTVPLATLREEEFLPPLRTELWRGWIFISFDAAIEPLAPTLRKLDPFFDGYDVDDMVLVPPVFIDGSWPWNWKQLLENYIDAYHTEFVHPVIHDFAPSVGPGVEVEFTAWSDDDNAIIRSVPFLEPDGGLTDEGWAAPAAFPVIQTLAEHQRRRVSFGMIPPTMNLIFTPDMICYGLVYPTGPTSLTVGGGLFTAGGWLVPRSTRELPDFDARAARLMEGSRQLGEQDRVVNTSVQRSRRSRYAPRGRYSWLEETLAQFNRWLVRRYLAADVSQEG